MNPWYPFHKGLIKAPRIDSELTALYPSQSDLNKLEISLFIQKFQPIFREAVQVPGVARRLAVQRVPLQEVQSEGRRRARQVFHAARQHRVSDPVLTRHTKKLKKTHTILELC
jgi:hypothetical protein